jgi:hypothetical protein
MNYVMKEIRRQAEGNILFVFESTLWTKAGLSDPIIKSAPLYCPVECLEGKEKCMATSGSFFFLLTS